MPSNETTFLAPLRRILSLVRLVFPLAVLILIVRVYKPVKLEPHPVMMEGLLTGSNQGYVIPGSELAPFKVILPSEGTLTFLTDHPFKDVVKEMEFYHRAQNYLCPLVLNPRPQETAGILYSQDDATAQKRLQETEYRMVARLAEGKGIIVKEPRFAVKNP